MAEIRLERVTKSFGKLQIIKGVDLDIHDREFVVFVGPSGCGKSTLLRLVAGLEDITSGKLYFDGKLVNELPPSERGISMVFQSYALYPHMTVKENMGFGLKLANTDPAAAEARVAEAARILQLEPLLDRKPRQLSGGQRQRVALARAIIRRPSVFLMDEPLSNLDAKLRGHMRAELKHMQESFGITTIYVTHDQIEAMTLAHRVAILEKGVLQQLATPAEIYNNPANLFVAQFIGSPPMNIVHGALQGDTFVAEGHKVKVPVKGRLDKAILGVRPEDCTVTTPAKGAFTGVIFTNELIGDHTLITVKTAKDTITVKAPKDYRGKSGDKIGVGLAKSGLYIFNGDGGARMR